MRDEMARSMARLRLADYEKPYFIAYTVRDYDSYEITGRLGAVFSDGHRRNRHAYVEVRVGSYQLDNSGNERDIAIDLDEPEAYEPSTDAPIDDDPQALRSALWLLTDHKYK